MTPHDKIKNALELGHDHAMKSLDVARREKNSGEMMANIKHDILNIEAALEALPTAEQQSSAEPVYFIRTKEYQERWFETDKNYAELMHSLGKHELRILYAHPPAEAPQELDVTAMLDNVMGLSRKDHRCSMCGYVGVGMDHLGQCPRCHWDELFPVDTAPSQAAAMPPAVQTAVPSERDVIVPRSLTPAARQYLQARLEQGSRADTVYSNLLAALASPSAAPLSDDSRRLVDEALAKVQELGTIGAMKWLARALSRTAPEVARLNQLAFDLARVVWQLNKEGYIHTYEQDEEARCEHFLNMAMDYVDAIRKLNGIAASPLSDQGEK